MFRLGCRGGGSKIVCAFYIRRKLVYRRLYLTHLRVYKMFMRFYFVNFIYPNAFLKTAPVSDGVSFATSGFPSL